ncbi:MAG: hypothetical protein K8M05_33915, partial [Deltaproteobacteria bacterium]|nr:hypothetical protein [Kofleriaceae bacterium]
MGTRDVDAMRMLVRHQWVREHGTPRVTTLAGRPAASRALWLEWMRLTGRARAARTLFEQPARASASWIESTARKAMALATSSPREPVAIAFLAVLSIQLALARAGCSNSVRAGGQAHPLEPQRARRRRSPGQGGDARR